MLNVQGGLALGEPNLRTVKRASADRVTRRLDGLALVRGVLVDAAAVDLVAAVLTVSRAVTVLLDRNALLVAGRTVEKGRVRFVLIGWTVCETVFLVRAADREVWRSD